jgi:hypothetical protein
MYSLASTIQRRALEYKMLTIPLLGLGYMLPGQLLGCGSLNHHHEHVAHLITASVGSFSLVGLAIPFTIGHHPVFGQGVAQIPYP